MYYVYLDLNDDNQVQEQICFHRQLCEQLELKGRIRISSEGINGVLSGTYSRLQNYEQLVTKELETISRRTIHLDVKYCLLREDIPLESQLFENLMVKKTHTVISLFDAEPMESKRRHRRRRLPQSQNDEEKSSLSTGSVDPTELDLNRLKQAMMHHNPSPHLTATEWDEHLLNHKHGKALLLDVRNVYESRVGRFMVPDVPTLLTNTRKYSDLPHLLATNPHVQAKQEIYMYCTGGVRCERVSMLVQSLYPEKKIYQLQGGIQTYLASQKGDNNESCGLFHGKNFVFDPRRTDPIHGPVPVIGKCLVCSTPHDDYDNGHSPSEEKEARCNTCRMLILVCNSCRCHYACWGEVATDQRERLFCGLDQCNHEGAAPLPELVTVSSSNPFPPTTEINDRISKPHTHANRNEMTSETKISGFL